MPSQLTIIVRVFVYLITVSVYLHDFSLVLVSIGNWKYVSNTQRFVQYFLKTLVACQQYSAVRSMNS